MVAMEVCVAALLAIGVVLGRDVLQGVLDADRSGEGWRKVLPSLVGLAIISVGASAPSNSICSIRACSWKYSRCRAAGSAHIGCAESDGAQCAESSSERARHRAPT